MTLSELKTHVIYENYYESNNRKKAFEGQIDFPLYAWGIKPELKNHVGAPESFYSGQIGLLIANNFIFNKNSYLNTSVGLGIFQNLDQLKLKAFSRLPKVRSDIREYLKQKYVIKDITYTNIFNPIYSKNYLFFGGIKLGLFEEMYGGIGGEILFRDINKPWYLTAN